MGTILFALGFLMGFSAAMTGYNPFTLEATSDPEVLPLDLVVGSVGSELDERNPA